MMIRQKICSSRDHNKSCTKVNLSRHPRWFPVVFLSEPAPTACCTPSPHTPHPHSPSLYCGTVQMLSQKCIPMYLYREREAQQEGVVTSTVCDSHLKNGAHITPRAYGASGHSLYLLAHAHDDFDEILLWSRVFVSNEEFRRVFKTC